MCANKGIPEPTCEGEEWGRRLWEIRTEECNGIMFYDDISSTAQGDANRTALRFRTECVAEVVARYEDLVRAVEDVVSWAQQVRPNLTEMTIPRLCEAYEAFLALSVPAPSAPDVPPKPRLSDEELGRFAWREFHPFVVNSKVHISPGVFTQIGAAIRAKLEGK